MHVYRLQDGNKRSVCRKPKMKFSMYMERDLPILKQDKPGLKAPQYKVQCRPLVCIKQMSLWR